MPLPLPLLLLLLLLPPPPLLQLLPALLLQGNPLVVRLYVPLWVINATQLPITVGIVAVDLQV